MNLMSQMLLADPVRPVAIWLILIVVSVPALLLLGSPEALRHPRLALLEVIGGAQRYQRQQERAQREAVETVRYAEEVRVAAERAHESSERWQELWRQADQHANEAWQARQDAEDRLTRARAAAAFTPASTTQSATAPSTPDTTTTSTDADTTRTTAAFTARTATGYVDRERFLHRSLRAAVDAGDLPVEAWRAGWDPRLHPLEQEFVLLQAINEHRQAAYRRAVAVERAAWHDSQTAFTAQDSLRREAALAALRATAVRANVPDRRSNLAPARRAWVQQIA